MFESNKGGQGYQRHVGEGACKLIGASVQAHSGERAAKTISHTISNKNREYACRRLAHFLPKYKRFCFLVFFTDSVR